MRLSKAEWSARNARVSSFSEESSVCGESNLCCIRSLLLVSAQEKCFSKASSIIEASDSGVSLSGVASAEVCALTGFLVLRGTGCVQSSVRKLTIDAVTSLKLEIW